MFTRSPQSEQHFLGFIIHDRRFIADTLVGTPSPIHRRRQQFWFSMVSFYSILFFLKSIQVMEIIQENFHYS